MKLSVYLCFVFLAVIQTNILVAQNSSNSIVLTEEEYDKLLQRKAEASCSSEKEIVNKPNTGRITLSVGGGINYMYGKDIDANADFDNDYLSWYGEGVLGYKVNTNQIGLFLSIGNTNKQGIQKFLEEGSIGNNSQGLSQNLYYKLEAGAVLLNTFRISTGSGYQEFRDASDTDKSVYYYSTTTGLHIGQRNFKVALDLNFMYGRELEKTILRPSIGVMFQL